MRLDLTPVERFQQERMEDIQRRLTILETKEMPAIGNSLMAPMAAYTIKGNDLAVLGPPKDLTATETVTMLTGQVSSWEFGEVRTSLITGVSGGITFEPGFSNGSRFDPIYGTLQIEPPNSATRDTKLYVYNNGDRSSDVILDGPTSSSRSLLLQSNSTTRSYLQWLSSNNTTVLANAYGPIQLSPGASGSATPMLELTTTGSEFNDQITIDQNNTGRHGIVVDMPSSTTGYAFVAQYNSANALLFWTSANRNQINFPARNLGNNEPGSGMIIGRNASAGAEGGAPGYIYMMRANGNAGVIYPDNSNVLRIHNAVPTGSAGTPAVDITAGTVVGSQTSHITKKTILGDAISPAEALQNIVDAAGMVKKFYYKAGEFNYETFEVPVLSGPVKHRYGMDADAAHPAGRSLNVSTLHGDEILAITELARQVQVIAAHLGISLN